MHRDMGGRGSHRRASHSGSHSSTLRGSDRGEYREGSNCNQEAAHDEYLGSRAAGPFLPRTCIKMRHLELGFQEV